MALSAKRNETRSTITAISDIGRAMLRSLLASSVSRVLTGAPNAHHLLIIPQDLRTADPSFASELYDGYFGLAGTVALTGLRVAIHRAAAESAVAKGTVFLWLAE